MTYISMSQRELDRYEIIQSSLRRELSVDKAAQLLNLTTRHLYNLRNKVKQQGAQGLVHASRGKPSNRKVPEEERDKIVKLIKANYSDFKPTHVSEKLSKLHGIKRDPKTIRTIMARSGLWKPRKRRKNNYRIRRPRKENPGEMIQFDGSYHHWLEGRGGSGELCLLAAIDDATGRVKKAQLKKHEGVLPVFGFWKSYLLNHGKPHSIYLDKLRTYYNNLLPERDEQALTQFQRAMKKFDVKLIVAHSPQAKGRIERLFETLQDRLVKEMRLKGISDLKTANRFIEREFIPWFNERYGVEPVKSANLHRKLTLQEKKRLPSVFSRQWQRVVLNDFTIRFDNRWYQLLKDQPTTIRPRERVLLEERLDNSLKIRLGDKYLNYRLLKDKPNRQIISNPYVIAANQERKKPSWKPASDHPWKKPFLVKNY